MPKATKPRRHLYAAIEHRVIDSPAFADLGFAAKTLLLLLARQLTKDNNGHLQATYGYCRRYGYGSEHTLKKAIADLIGHGFVYRTRSWGANQAWARYALTWLPIKKRDGLFLNGFEPCAWRTWEPSEKKTSRQKVLDQSSRKCSFTPKVPAESAGNTPAKNAGYELCTSTATAPHGDWIIFELARLGQLGLAGQQCFSVQPSAHRLPSRRCGALMVGGKP